MTERYSGSLLYQVVKGDIRFATTHREQMFTLTGGVDLVLRLNPRRLTFLLVNRSSSTVEVAFSPGILPGGGILLSPDGGSITVTWLEDGELAGSEVYVSGVADSRVYTLEVVATTGGEVV